MKIKCTHCNKIATWSYMPGDDHCCDDCVPRGCSCNFKYSSELDEDGCVILLLNKEGDPIEEVDPNTGLLYPCCEWDYDPFGMDEYDDDEHYRLLDWYNKEYPEDVQ